MTLEPAIAAWWGFTQADGKVVGVVVAIVALAALGYLGRRFWGRSGD